MANVFGTNGSEVLNSLDGVTNGSDLIWGLGGNDSIFGLGGADEIKGGGGADALDGGSGADTAFYSDSSEGVIVSLTSGEGFGGTAEGDTLTNIENLAGSSYADVLLGNSGNNVLDGGSGNDTLKGYGGSDTLFGDGGNDTLVGGAEGDDLIGGTGTDTASYLGSSAGVFVDLDSGFASGGDAEDDSFSSIENLAGSSHDDFLWGDAGVNGLEGGAGDDELKGWGGNDTLEGQSGADELSGGIGSDTLLGGSGNDTLEGGANADFLTGGTGDDTFVFRPGDVGDIVIDFAGNGAAAGDILRFEGFGAGATLTQLDATTWQVTYDGGASSELLAINNGAAIHASDYLFV